MKLYRFSLALVFVTAISCPFALAQSTWNPSDKDSNVTLSGGNLIATQNSLPTTFKAVRGTVGYTSGSANKRVFTITVTSVDSTTGWIGGWGNGSAGLTYPGSTGSSAGWQEGNNLTYRAGLQTAIQTCGGTHPFTASAILYFALDFANKYAWCSTDCASWTGAIGNPDSPSGATLMDTSTTYYPMWGGYDGGGGTDSATYNGNPSLAGCSHVTSFSSWDTVVSTKCNLMMTGMC